MAKQQGNEPQVIPSQGLATLEQLGKEYSLTSLETMGKFERAVRMADGIGKLRAALDPFMPAFMTLAGSKLGFRTDRDSGDKGPYSVSVVKEAIIEATIRGVLPFLNQFNIIAGNCYITKEGFEHILREMPGLTDLRKTLALPRFSGDKGCTIETEASWKYNGKADTLKRTFAIRLTAGGGADQAAGKATRKLLAAVYSQITGSDHTDDYDDLAPAEITAPRPSQTDTVAGLVGQKAAEVKTQTATVAPATNGGNGNGSGGNLPGPPKIADDGEPDVAPGDARPLGGAMFPDMEGPYK